MRLRPILLVLTTALVVVFALLNRAEITRPVPLDLVWQTVNAPLALILLGLLALAVVGALASGAAAQARQRRLQADHAKALQAQRDLAERAEASRFVDLRQALDTHLRETRDREATSAAELDQALAKTQRELRNQLELLHRSLSTRLGEMEARLEQRMPPPGSVPPSPVRAGSPLPPADLRSEGDLKAQPDPRGHSFRPA